MIDILLQDPRGIVEAVDGIFKTAIDQSLGRNGAVTKFNLPIIGGAVSRSLKAGTSKHFLEKSRQIIVGTMEGILTSYDEKGSRGTVADLITVDYFSHENCALVKRAYTKNPPPISATQNPTRKPSPKPSKTPTQKPTKYPTSLRPIPPPTPWPTSEPDECSSSGDEIKSLMWTIPFGELIWSCVHFTDAHASKT